MPTYVYACDSCDAQFEQMQRFSDAPLTDCPRCAGTVRRVFQPVGIVFKGSGWYVTDSRKPASATPAAKADEAGAPAKAEGESAASPSAPAGETKPAPASEAKPAPASPAPAGDAKPA